MTMNGQRYMIERQRLCAWLEEEQRRAPERAADLQREFRTRLDRLYAEARAELEPRRPVETQ
jgi:hypothetical protein